MARYYHVDAAKGLSAPPVEGKDTIPVPPSFGGGERPFVQGALTLGVVGVGFCVVEPGSYVDLPDEMSRQAVRDFAPQLLSKDEAIKVGFCNEDGSIKSAIVDDKKKTAAKKPQEGG